MDPFSLIPIDAYCIVKTRSIGSDPQDRDCRPAGPTSESDPDDFDENVANPSLAECSV
jgi:hypothetical protein